MVALFSPGGPALAGVVGLVGVTRQTIAIGAGGDVVVAGDVRVGRNFGTIEVVKISGATGRLLWSRRLQGQRRQPGDEAASVAVDASGDVFVGGSLYRQTRSLFAVAKLSGRTGSRRWLTIVPSGVPPEPDTEDGMATQLTVASNGDVIAVGVLGTGMEHSIVTLGAGVARLSGRTGAIEWQYQNADPGGLEFGAVDGNGDVVAAGSLSAFKLAGTDGSVLWRNTATGADARAIRVDPHDDVVLGGAVGPHALLGAAKLSGADGHVFWAGTISTPPGAWQSAYDVRVDATGDVIAAGFTGSVDSTTFTVAKFAGETGVERWRRIVGGTGGSATANALVVDPVGDVVVTGTVLNGTTCFDWFVGKLAGASGALVWQRNIDGTEKARLCEWDGSEGGGPPPPHVATDDDEGEEVTLDAQGRVVAVGLLSNRMPDDEYARRTRTLTVRHLSLATGARTD